MHWIYSFILLLAFLFFFLIGIQKLRLGFKIFTNETQLELFNTVVALCLIVSGTLGLVSLFVTAWLLLLGNQDGELMGQQNSFQRTISDEEYLDGQFMGQQNSFQRTILNEKHLYGQFMGQRNNTQSTISDEKHFRKEPFDGTNPKHQYRLCRDFCTNKQNSKNLHPVTNETPPTGICFRIFRNFSDQKSCQFFTDLQGNNSFEHREEKTKRSVVGFGSVRRALCWIHLQSHFLQWIFYISSLFQSLLFRYFLIRWPHGFLREDPKSPCPIEHGPHIRAGETNLGLFKQLFFLSSGVMLLVVYTPEFSLQLEGLYPKNSMQGRICMLSNLQRLSAENKMKQKVQVMTIVAVVVFFIGNIYCVTRVKRLMAGLCPSKKMSCIGKFRRNVLDKNETYWLVIYLSTGGLLNVTCNLLFVKFEQHLQPSVIFNLNTFFWLVLLEFPMLYLTFILTQREIPRIAEIPRCTKFYVLKPHLEPRRCSYANPSLVNDMRDEGQLEDMTILDNSVQLVLPPIDHISQGNHKERKDLKGKAKGGRHLQQSVNNIGEGSSGWFNSPPVS